MTDTPPITVTTDPKVAQLAVGIRQLVLALGMIAGTLGYAHVGNVIGAFAMVAGPVASIVVVIMGQMHERHTVAKAVELAQALPATVTVK